MLVLTTDGRLPLLRATLASADESLYADWHRRILVDDSGDLGYADQLEAELPGCTLIHHPHRAGFAATVRTAWTAALAYGASHVFHLEDDFTFNEPVSVDALISVLWLHPILAQIALKRQPVNDTERAVGGLMETHPPQTWRQRNGFVEHVLNFTTNPGLIPAHAIERALLSPRPLTEPNITETLLDAGYVFGYLGRIEDAPRVTHIGHERSAGWLA